MEEDEDTLGIQHMKKKNYNQSQVVGIGDEDMTLLTEVVTEVAEKNLGNLTSRKTSWMDSITTKVNQLEETMAEVCDTMQDETYGVDPTDTLVMPVLLPPLIIEMPTQEFSTEEAEKEASVHSLETLTLYFSKLTLPQIYSI